MFEILIIVSIEIFGKNKKILLEKYYLCIFKI